MGSRLPHFVPLEIVAVQIVNNDVHLPIVIQIDYAHLTPSGVIILMLTDISNYKKTDYQTYSELERKRIEKRGSQTAGVSNGRG